MKKYLGIVKETTESAIGVNVRILTKFSNYKRVLKKWMKLHNNTGIILENNSVLESFFEDFEDYRPVTDAEKAAAQKAYENLMMQD